MSRKLMAIALCSTIVVAFSNCVMVGIVIFHLMKPQSDQIVGGSRYTFATFKDMDSQDRVLIADNKTGELDFLDYELQLNKDGLSPEQKRAALAAKDYRVNWFRSGKVWNIGELFMWKENTRDLNEQVKRAEAGPIGVHPIYDKQQKQTLYWVAGDGHKAEVFTERKEANDRLQEIKDKGQPK